MLALLLAAIVVFDTPLALALAAAVVILEDSPLAELEAGLAPVLDGVALALALSPLEVEQETLVVSVGWTVVYLLLPA